MAKRTYYRTLFYRDLTEAKVVLYLTKEIKYAGVTEDDEHEVVLTGVTSWTVIEGGEEADAIETIVKDTDEYHEYLILTFTDGHTAIYRNSHTIMFIH